MKVQMAEYDPAQITIDDEEALRESGLELLTTPEKRIAVFMEIGNLFNGCEKEDMQYGLEFKPDADRIAAGGI